MFPRFFAAPGLVVESSLKKLAATLYRDNIVAKGLHAYFSPESLVKSQASVKVFANQHYFNTGEQTPSLHRVLAHTLGVNVAGDRDGFFQDFTPLPKIPKFFENLKPGDARGLAPSERLIAGKKIIFSNSLVKAHGGYPANKPKIFYKKPFEAGIFSQAGAQFEMPYLHYGLFCLDPLHSDAKDPLFAHLYQDLPASFTEAKEALGDYDFTNDLGRIRVGFPYLARSGNGGFYSSLFRKNAIIFLNKAYERHIYEDTALLLASVNEAAKASGKPAFLKATAIGMGYFSKVDCHYDIKHHLYPYCLRAFRDLLATGQYPNIALVEFPIFSTLFQEFYTGILTEKSYGGVRVQESARDVLEFSEAERDTYYVCVTNPSDANALPGNEWGDGSVEAAIANNTSLRFDQVHLMNPKVLEPESHVFVGVDPKHFTVEMNEVESTSKRLY